MDTYRSVEVEDVCVCACINIFMKIERVREYLGVIKLQGSCCNPKATIRVYWINWILEIDMIIKSLGAKQETNHPTAI